MKKIYILYILSELTNKPNTPDIEKPSTSLHAHTTQSVNNLNYIAWHNTFAALSNIAVSCSIVLLLYTL